MMTKKKQEMNMCAIEASRRLRGTQQSFSTRLSPWTQDANTERGTGKPRQRRNFPSHSSCIGPKSMFFCAILGPPCSPGPCCSLHVTEETYPHLAGHRHSLPETRATSLEAACCLPCRKKFLRLHLCRNLILFLVITIWDLGKIQKYRRTHSWKRPRN